MAEDSGAFKTNPANSRQIPAFCDRPERRCSEASPVQETLFRRPTGHRSRRFLTNATEYVAVSSNQPDSLRAGGVRRVANAANSVVTAFPMSQGLRTRSCEGGIRVHAARLSFSVRRDRVVDVDTGLRARRGGVAARSSRGICQQPIVARDAPETKFARNQDRKTDQGPCWRCCGSNRPEEPQRQPRTGQRSGISVRGRLTASQAEPEGTATSAAKSPRPAEPEKNRRTEAEDNSTPPEAAKPEIPVPESPAQQRGGAGASRCARRRRRDKGGDINADISRHRRRKSPRRRAKLPRQRRTSDPARFAGHRQPPRPKSPRSAAQPSPSKQRRRRKPSRQATSRASSRSARGTADDRIAAGLRARVAAAASSAAARPVRSVAFAAARRR